MKVILDNREIYREKEVISNSVKARHSLLTEIFGQDLSNIAWLLTVHRITEKIFLFVLAFTLFATHLIKPLKAKLYTKVAFTELARIATNASYADSVKFFLNRSSYNNGNLLQLSYLKIY